MKDTNEELALYEAGRTSIISFGSRERLEKTKAEYGGEIMELSKAMALIDDLIEAKYSKAPSEITKDEYDDALNCLPPARWDGTVFLMSERTIGSYTAFYAKCEGRYFCGTRDYKKTSNRDFFDECQKVGA